MPASSERDGAHGERERERERETSPCPLRHARSLHTKLNRRDINLTFSIQRPSSFFHWHELQPRTQPQLHVVNFIPPFFHKCMRPEGRLNPFWKHGANTIRVSIEKREGRKRGRMRGGICIIIKSADPNLHIPIAFLADQRDALLILDFEDGLLLESSLK